jgi:hypothetical protein
MDRWLRARYASTAFGVIGGEVGHRPSQRKNWYLSALSLIFLILGMMQS